MKHVKQTHIYKIIENSILIFFLISFLIFELGRIFSANKRFNQTRLLSQFVLSLRLTQTAPIYALQVNQSLAEPCGRVGKRVRSRPENLFVYLTSSQESCIL